MNFVPCFSNLISVLSRMSSLPSMYGMFSMVEKAALAWSLWLFILILSLCILIGMSSPVAVLTYDCCPLSKSKPRMSHRLFGKIEMTAPVSTMTSMAVSRRRPCRNILATGIVTLPNVSVCMCL